jgi:prepilin-type N-terminal cleavage/methylation domain-containing protein
MRRPSVKHRRGMSLVELLVVVAILGLLAVTVLPNLANTTESRRSREAVRVASTFVSNAKSRAIGRREWSGFMLVAAAPGAAAAVDLFLADVPSPYRGDTADATVTCSGTNTGSSPPSRTATAVVTELGSSLAFVASLNIQPGDQIRFDGRGPLFEILAPPTSAALRFGLPGATEQGATEGLGYSPQNTPWPAADPVRHTFEIVRRPEVSGAPLTLTDGRAIDLRWSGMGSPLSSEYVSFSNASPVFVMFDGTGRLRQVVLPTGRVTVTSAVFLLLGRADRAGQNPAPVAPSDDSGGANFQYGDSHWIVIDPTSGVAKVAECVPSPVPLGTSAAEINEMIVASQRWIRESLVTDGR